MKPDWRMLIASLALAGGLAACVGLGPGGQKELATMSDQTSSQKRAEIRVQLASAYYERGQLDVALDEIKLALQSEPDYVDAISVRALIYVRMGELVLAEANFARAMKLAPDNPDLANNYGSFLCQNGRGAQAIAYFERALKSRAYRSPVAALNNAGSCSLTLKDLDAAERYLQDALRIEPHVAATNVNLARVYLERRDYGQAGFFIERLKTLVKIDTLGADVLWLAIKVERALGHRDAEAVLVSQLRRRHPGSTEFAAFQRGAFNE